MSVEQQFAAAFFVYKKRKQSKVRISNDQGNWVFSVPQESSLKNGSESSSAMGRVCPRNASGIRPAEIFESDMRASRKTDLKSMV